MPKRYACAIVKVEYVDPISPSRVECLCGWKSGRRKTVKIALQSWAAHAERKPPCQNQPVDPAADLSDG